MKPSSSAIILTCSFLVMGCAHIDFGPIKVGEIEREGGVTFFEPVPYLFVSTTTECVSTATVTIIPGQRRELKFKGGYGSYKLSVALSNGMISSVGQEADSKVPETIASIGTLAGAFTKALVDGKPIPCEPTARLYPIDDKGIIDPTKYIKVDPESMKGKKGQ